MEQHSIAPSGLLLLATIALSSQGGCHAFAPTVELSPFRSGYGVASHFDTRDATIFSSELGCSSSSVLARGYVHRTVLCNALQNDSLLTDSPERKLDMLLDDRDLRGAIRQLENNPNLSVPKERFLEIFNAIECRTTEAEENNLNKRFESPETMNAEYPLSSPARTEMTKMYSTLSKLGHTRLFGAASKDRYLAAGSKIVTPTLLETITDLSMVALTPKPTNTLLLAGAALAITEGFVSLYTGIDLNFLIFTTLILAACDKLLVNGAVFETAMKIFMPEVNQKILKHEAGHFLCAYLLGCPVEGCVLSSWAALKDARFGGRSTNVSAGTSFFDPELSEQINGRKPLSRSSIDRYSVIVMGGIAAEAINFGRADGGAGDEMALIRFLNQINPRGGGAVVWDSEMIRNQARWGALQAVLLLREYRACYDALVDALERGGDLGDCVFAIEKAGRDHNLNPVEKPAGYILDKGIYGEWADSAPREEDESKAVVKDALNVVSSLNGDVSSTLSPTSLASEEGTESSEEFLKKSRKLMEEKLRKIDNQLEEIDRSNGSYR